MRARPWFLVLVLMLVAGVGMLHAQTVDSTSVSGGNADAAYGVEVLAKLIAMALGSWLFGKWNVAQGRLDGINNLFKQVIVTVLVTGLGMLGTLVHVAVSTNVADWGEAFWASLASGIVTALVGKFAIGSHMAKRAAPPASTIA